MPDLAFWVWNSRRSDKPVDNSSTSHKLSTGDCIFEKLSPFVTA